MRKLRIGDRVAITSDYEVELIDGGTIIEIDASAGLIYRVIWDGWPGSGWYAGHSLQLIKRGKLFMVWK